MLMQLPVVPNILADIKIVFDPIAQEVDRYDDMIIFGHINFDLLLTYRVHAREKLLLLRLLLL